jgi:hypothetical protein
LNKEQNNNKKFNANEVYKITIHCVTLSLETGSDRAIERNETWSQRVTFTIPLAKHRIPGGTWLAKLQKY